MPKISDEARQNRRSQILDAAWKCFQREGLHATTMQHIIRASGLSAGAVYSYFKSKDDLIVAAVTSSLSGLRLVLGEALRSDPPRSPEDLAARLLPKIAGFAQRDGYDLRRIALLGWSEAQRNERLRSAMVGHYRAFRDDLGTLAGTWGIAAPADRDAMAKLLLAVLLGGVVQSALLGDTKPEEIAAGLRLLQS